MSIISPVFNEASYSDQSGFPLAGGQIWQYYAGSTEPTTTYADRDRSVENPNPIILNANGRAGTAIWLDGGSLYNLVLTDADGNPLVQFDNIGQGE
jgi:hypothetical protein